MSAESANSWLSIDKDSRYTQFGLPIVGTLSVLVGWQLITDQFGIVPPMVLPSPVQIYQEYSSLQSLIHSHLWTTILESAVGFTIAVSLSLVTGVVLTTNDSLRNSLMPLIIGGNSVPRVALAPIIIFYIGGFQAKYLIAAWIAFFPMLVHTLEGFRSIGEDVENLLNSLDASLWQEYRYVRVYNALPYIFDGMKISITLAIVGAVVGEFVASERGIGYLALFALRDYNMPLVFALVGIMGIISAISFVTLYILQDRIVHWQQATLLTE